MPRSKKVPKVERAETRRRGRPKGSMNRAKRTARQGGRAGGPRGRASWGGDSLSARLGALAAELERIREELVRVEDAAGRAERIRSILGK